MPALKAEFFELAVRADAVWDRFSRRVRRRLGLARPLRILPYRGYGTQERVLEDQHVRPAHQRHTLVGSAIASYKRYATREIPGARVAVRWGDKRWEGTTDEEGFLVLWVEPPEGVAPGWNQVELELLAP